MTVQVMYTILTLCTRRVTTALLTKVALTITNDTRDDVVTQAAGRPLVGQSAIDAASLVGEEEDLTIYGNVGTAIDVNGGDPLTT